MAFLASIKYLIGTLINFFAINLIIIYRYQILSRIFVSFRDYSSKTFNLIMMIYIKYTIDYE